MKTTKLLILTLTAALVATASTVSGQTSQCLTPPMDSTGTTDVTAQMNAFFANLPDNSCVVFPRPSSVNPAKYKVSDQVKIEYKTNIDVFGNGATIFLSRERAHSLYTGHIYKPHLFIADSKDILIQDLKIRGAEYGINSTPCTAELDRKDDPDTKEVNEARVDEEFEAGVAVQWSEDVTLLRMDIREVSGDGFFVGWGNRRDGWAHGQDPCQIAGTGSCPVVVPRSKRIRIVDSVVDCNGRQGMALAWTDGLQVRGNRLDRIALTGIDVEHYEVTDLVVADNSFGRVRDQLFISSSRVVNLDFLRNTSEEPIYMVIRGGGAINANFIDNVGGKIMGNDGTIFAENFLEMTKGGPLRIVNNRQAWDPGSFPVLSITPPSWPGGSGTFGVCNVHVEGNDFFDAPKLFDRKPSMFPPGCGWTDINNRY